MAHLAQQKRRDAVNTLIKIAVWEGFVLMAVVGAWLVTGSIPVLIGGLVASMLLFGPVFLRWAKEYGRALKTSAEENGGG